MKLNSIGIRNLKSFGSEKQMIDLKSINILVGKNSSGKSTFARTFPLFKQSASTRTSKSPILWNGDIIDFGDFCTAVREGENNISFDFIFDDFGTQEDDQLLLTMSIVDLGESILNTVSLEFEDLQVSLKYDGNYQLLELAVSNQNCNFILKDDVNNHSDRVEVGKNFILIPNNFLINIHTDHVIPINLEDFIVDRLH